MADPKSIALAIIVFLVPGWVMWQFTGCAAYQSTVSARQLGVDGKGAVSYRVEYAR